MFLWGEHGCAVEVELVLTAKMTMLIVKAASVKKHANCQGRYCMYARRVAFPYERAHAQTVIGSGFRKSNCHVV